MGVAHRAGVGEGVVVHYRDGAGLIAIGVVGLRWCPPAAMAAFGVKAVHLPGIDMCAVAGIDVAKIAVAGAVGRLVNVARPERKPAHRPAADAYRNAGVAVADEGHERGRIHRPVLPAAGQPAPVVVQINPAPIVEGREAPGRVVHPGPAPRREPDPVAIAIGCPTGFQSARIPHRPVAAFLAPVAVVVEFAQTDDLAGGIAPRAAAGDAAVALGGPAVEVIVARQAGAAHIGKARVVEAVAAARRHLVARRVRAIDRAGTAEHAHGGAAATAIDIHPVLAGASDDEGEASGVDLVGLLAADTAQAEVGATIEQLQLGAVVVDVANEQFAAVIKAYLSTTEVERGAGAAGSGDAVTRHQRPVERDLAESALARCLKAHFAFNETQARHAAGGV